MQSDGPAVSSNGKSAKVEPESTGAVRPRAAIVLVKDPLSYEVRNGGAVVANLHLDRATPPRLYEQTSALLDMAQRVLEEILKDPGEQNVVSAEP